MIVVHHLEDSRSQRILWLLEELAVPYEVKRYARDPKTRLAPPELLAVHPLGKSPVITDEGRAIAETGAIVAYLLERYGDGRLSPQTADERLDCVFWSHFAEGSAMPPLVMKMVFQTLPGSVPFFLRPIVALIGKGLDRRFLDPTISRQLQLMEADLAKGEWFAGAGLTGADIMMSFPVEAVATGIGLGAYPRLAAWLARIHARPAYRAALARGGPYAFGGM